MENKIKAVIIDDSAFMRKAISIMLEDDDVIEVVGTAKNGLEGYEMVKSLSPDVVTLDIEMPVMDGLTALEKIMKDCPTSVLMVSSLTTEGAESTMRALELGAVDFIPKELSYVNVNIINIKDELVRKVKAIVQQRSFRNRLRAAQSKSPGLMGDKVATRRGKLPKSDYNAVALGVSTGGPMSLQKVIPRIRKDIKQPIFIVQHMPPKFTKSLADRLDNLSEVHVKEAEHGEIIKAATVYIAPGGSHMTFKKSGSGVTIILSDTPSDTLHRPSVDVMMNSAIDIYGKKMLGIIMTGMGKDGLEGISRLKKLGGYCLAQNEESCVVYGMPRAIVDNNYADAVTPLESIADVVNEVL
ncbi:MAG: chemotaxis response regulator protein-glutamate methylesterase [Bacteroidetes bacterium]|nr:chemotaxis response regulator protein-glutamate methylesterase [Bacteroidota bacterium]